MPTVSLSVPYTARRSNQSILRKISPEYSLEYSAKAETPILCPPDPKNWLFEKDPDAGKDWRREENGKTEDEMVGWHHWLDGHEFEQALGVGDGQGSLVCCSPWGRKESDTTEWLNWTELCDQCCSGIWRQTDEQSKYPLPYGSSILAEEVCQQAVNIICK